MQIQYYISHGVAYAIAQSITSSATVSLISPAAEQDGQGLAPTVAEIRPEHGKLMVYVSPELITIEGAADAVAVAIESVGYATNKACRKILHDFGTGKNRPGNTASGVYHPITDVLFAALPHSAE